MRTFVLPLLTAVIVLVFSLMALVFRGHQALDGITWGLDKYTNLSLGVYKLCGLQNFVHLKQPSFCKIDFEKSKVNLGFYDPAKQYDKAHYVAIDHYFVSWLNVDSSALLEQLNETAMKNRWPMITVEPWAKGSGDTLFTDITSGLYDGEISHVCQNISAFGKPIFIRWGHEMDKVTGRYPWAKNDNAGYISAYKYFVSNCRSLTKNTVYYEWSPIGDQNLDAYFPGKEYVDIIGISVYSYPKYDLKNYGRVRSFNELFGEKYERLKKYNMSIMIAEFGVTGGIKNQKSWLLEAYHSFDNFPLLKTIVYFNKKDSENVWPDFPTPDWSLDPQVF